MEMNSHNNLICHQQTMPIITRKGNRLNRGLLNMPNEPNFDDACKTVYLRKSLLSSCNQHHLYGFLGRHAYNLEYNIVHSLAALLSAREFINWTKSNYY
jgi:hypothetical protein